MMKSSNVIFIITILISGLFLTSFALNPPAQTNLKAGFAKVNITPSEPVRMSGYGSRTEPYEGIHDDLFACASVFDNAELKTCIITADVIGFSHEFVDETRSLIQKQTGIPATNVMITAVHNHSAPTTGVYGDLTKTESEYVKTLQEKIVSAVKRANDHLQRVTMGTGKGTCKMNINRRARHADGGISLGRNPDGICDHEVGVIRFDDQSGKTLGLMVNWPCHAVVGGPQNYQVTGDWPGATARNLEQAYPNAVVMVSAGASGDINPIYGPNNKFNDINAIGLILSEEVIRITKSIDINETSNLEVVNRTITAEGKKRGESRMPNAPLEPGDPVDIRLSAMKIGNTLFVGISGELMNEIGLEIKAASPFKDTFVYTHCNGSSGYLCTDEAYPQGGYEPMVSRTMPGTEALIKDGVKGLIGDL
ncbi:MAG: neutral/alkaline non-lysosomal ceramidase N-terminal domain-containing protein [Bacteroidota bacterium]